MKKFILVAGLLLHYCCGPVLNAQKALPEEDGMRILDSIEHAFQWKTGHIDLPGNFAGIDIPANMRYLNEEQSRFVLADLWGNPPDLHTMGMLFPIDQSPLGDSCWAFNIYFEEMGYVKDGDAGDINYDELLAELKKETAAENESRTNAGYEALEIVGWASPPFYDNNKKVLHWAKEIKFGDGAYGNTLNYDVRFLGRKGVLSLNAIGSMNQLELVKGSIPAVTNGISFTDGNKYADFDSNIDNVAAWTIGGLVAGKVLAKVGFFAIILKFIKPILLLAAGGGAAIWRFISGRKNEQA